MICSSMISMTNRSAKMRTWAHVFIDTEVSHSFKVWRRYPLTLHPSINGCRFLSKSTVTTAITDSATTTEDTTIATTGRETLALNVAGLWTNEPRADGVEIVRVGADELLSLGITGKKKKKVQIVCGTKSANRWPAPDEASKIKKTQPWQVEFRFFRGYWKPSSPGFGQRCGFYVRYLGLLNSTHFNNLVN